MWVDDKDLQIVMTDGKAVPDFPLCRRTDQPFRDWPLGTRINERELDRPGSAGGCRYRSTHAQVDALRRKRIPHAYLAFEGEDHGFRRAENIQRSIEAELYFVARLFGFEPADELEPLLIANLD